MATIGLIVTSLYRQRGLYALWILSLAMAISGLVIVDVYRASLSETLTNQGAKILSAHVALSSRRTLTDEEVETFKTTLPNDARYSHVTELFAMVSTESESRLAALRFIDDHYPLVGELKRDTSNLSDNEAPAWAAPDLIPLMNLKIGDKVKVGQITFTIRGFIEKDSSQTFRGSSMAPRIYLPLHYLKATQLIQFGSTFKDTWFAALSATPKIDLKETISERFPDPTVEVTVPSDLEQGSLRVLSRLLDYLGLVGLVTLSLGWIGVFYLGRRWLMLEQKSGGLLKCLGLTNFELKRLWFAKLTAVLIVGVVVGGAFAWGAAYAVIPFFKSALPENFALIWSWRNTLMILLVGPGIGWILLFELILRTASEPALNLVAERPPLPRTAKSWILQGLGFVALAVTLTFLQARSWVVTYSFLAELAGSVVLIATISAVLLFFVERLRHPRQRWIWHTASAIWIRRPGLSILLVSVTAMCGLLSQLIPHLERTLIGELKSPTETGRPGLFLFDVQDEQVEPLTAKLKEHKIEISQISPMIRARLLKVNDVGFERDDVSSLSTREDESNARMRNRGVNLSYRDRLSPSEKTAEGRPFEDMSVQPAEISIEESYADRLNVKLGDRLLFDVQGIEIPATVVNLREVSWDSFEPNFFMQFRPGVVDEAPKTWVVTLKRHDQLSPPQIQKLLTKEFPNVTSINIEEAVDAISSLLTKLGAGLRVASRLTLALGIFVFVMILLFQFISSEKDWVQLYRQGVRRRDLMFLQLVAYGSLSLAGAILGTALSVIVTWTLSRWTFAIRPRFDWTSSAQILALTCALSLAAIVWISIRQNYRTQFKSRFDSL